MQLTSSAVDSSYPSYPIPIKMRFLRESKQLAGQATVFAALAASLIWFWDRARDPAIQVESLIAAGLLLRVLQCVLAPARRRSTHWLVQYGAWAAYYFPFPLASTAAVIMRTSSGDQFYLLPWCLMLYHAMERTANMTAYALADRLHDGRHHAQRLFYGLYLINVAVTAYQSSPLVSTETVFTWGSLVAAYYVLWTIPKDHDGTGPVATITMSSSSFQSKVVADFMMLESESGEPFFDGGNIVSLTSCKYLVNPSAHPSELPISRRKQVRIKDMMQRDMPDHVCKPELQELFLSYAFFHLLKRRYFGFDCAEEGDPRVQDFVLKVLLSSDDDASTGRRGYKVVEAQLAFLHDHFFTSYHASLKDHVWHTVKLIYASAYMMLLSANKTGARSAHTAFTVLALAVLLVLKSLEVMYYLASDWRKMAAVNGDFDKPSRFRRATTMLFRQQYWQNRIGQYSLVDDYDRGSARKAILARLQGFVFHETTDFIRHYPLEDEAVSLPEYVKKSVVATLVQSEGRLTNGADSLGRNGVSDDLSWTCSQPTHAHTILIWHIATSYCEMAPSGDHLTNSQASQEVSSYYDAATKLSKYCAYLVAFAPELLPDHSVTTTDVFQEVLGEARMLLGRAKSAQEKYERMKSLLLFDETERTVFEMGVILGRQLEELEDDARWKVMADFWVEALLYVAPSDNVAAHIERLAKGGEFVTHLWALLSNAGILKRS